MISLVIPQNGDKTTLAKTWGGKKRVGFIFFYFGYIEASIPERLAK
jgi:hypothetical protein